MVLYRVTRDAVCPLSSLTFAVPWPLSRVRSRAILADKVNKTTFPKIIDKGDLSSAVTFSAQLKFSLLPDDDGSVTVANVACGFKITQFDCKVLTGANKSLFKMLIGVFKAKLTETVGELVACVQSSWLRAN